MAPLAQGPRRLQSWLRAALDQGARSRSRARSYSSATLAQDGVAPRGRCQYVRLIAHPRTRLCSGRSLGAIAAAVAALHASCALPAYVREATLGGRDVSLRYEGSCAHLACCSRYAVSVPAATVGAFNCPSPEGSCGANVGWFAPGFTCDPSQSGRYRQPGDPPFLNCDDNERWLSLPGLGHLQCGETYLVCHRGVRVTAVARDKSASNESGRVHYEGSSGLLRAIGADLAARETFVSIYAMHETDRIAADPHCVGG